MTTDELRRRLEAAGFKVWQPKPPTLQPDTVAAPPPPVELAELLEALAAVLDKKGKKS